MQYSGSIGKSGLASHLIVVEAFKKADMLIDLAILLFSKEQVEIQGAKTRVLLCVELIEVLTQMFPTEEHEIRVKEAGARLRKAKTMRFTNEAETDVTYQLGQYPVIEEYGYADETGRWDHFPSGFLFTGGNDGGVNGTVVLKEEDFIFPFERYVTEPVTLSIRNGYIENIEGGLDAMLMKEYMEGFNDQGAYAISHIGWGLNEKAKWDALTIETRGIGIDGRLFLGNVLFSTGPNSELGGTNDTSFRHSYERFQFIS